MVFKSVLLHVNISLAYLNHLSSKMIVYKHATVIPLPSEVTSRILFLLCKRRKCFRGLWDLPRLIEYILLLIIKVLIFNGKCKHEFQIFKKDTWSEIKSPSRPWPMTAQFPPQQQPTWCVSFQRHLMHLCLHEYTCVCPQIHSEYEYDFSMWYELCQDSTLNQGHRFPYLLAIPGLYDTIKVGEMHLTSAYTTLTTTPPQGHGQSVGQHLCH